MHKNTKKRVGNEVENKFTNKYTEMGDVHEGKGDTEERAR